MPKIIKTKEGAKPLSAFYKKDGHSFRSVVSQKAKHEIAAQDRTELRIQNDLSDCMAIAA